MIAMNKTELISAVAAAAGVSKKDAANVLQAAVDAVTEAMAKGDKVQWIGFGTFEARERAARQGKDPRTGKAIDIAACKVPAFKAGAALKAEINK